MQNFLLFLFLCAVLADGAKADSLYTIDFEDSPNANIADFCGGGGINIGSFYSGVGVANIGADVFGLNTACGIAAYPPNSGDINVFSEDDFATITFNSPVSSVSVYYVSLDSIVLTAYDSSNILGSSIGEANTDGTTGANSLLSVTFSDISYVTLGNSGLADEFTFDDLSFTSPSTTPEPLPWALLAFGCILLGVRRLFRRVGDEGRPLR